MVTMERRDRTRIRKKSRERKLLYKAHSILQNLLQKYVEGQNDIKKLRRENEQLRREIWGLRDEYDKLEELLKKQKLEEKISEAEEENSENSSSTSDASDSSSNDEEDLTSTSAKNKSPSNNEERLENAENLKISSENALTLRVNPRLSVVTEEEETKKEDDHKPETVSSFFSLPYESCSSQMTSSSYGFSPECPFIFSNSGKFTIPGKTMENVFLIPTCSPICSNQSNPKSVSPGSPGKVSGLLSLAPFDQSPRTSESSAQTGSTVAVSFKTEPETTISSNIPAAPETPATSRAAKHFFSPLPSKSQDTKSKNDPFLSSEQLFTPKDTNAGKLLVKSLSCHDLPSLFKNELRDAQTSDPSKPFHSVILNPPPNFDTDFVDGSTALNKPLSVHVNDACTQPFCLGFLPLPSDDGKIQVTSFEKPSPCTLQFPQMTPCDLNLLLGKFRNPGIHCESCAKKVAQAQTSSDEVPKEADNLKTKKRGSQKKKDRLKKQSVVPDTPSEIVDLDKTRANVLEDKNESRSSSSSLESPRNKGYFHGNQKRKGKNLSLDIEKAEGHSGGENSETFEKDRRSESRSEKNRKTSTSSGNVPWCACWGNGCI